MKKKYITPTLKVVNIEVTPLMEGSQEIPVKTGYIESVDQVW